MIDTFGLESTQIHFHKIFQNVNFCPNTRLNEKFHILMKVTVNRFQTKRVDHLSTRHDRLPTFHGFRADFRLVYSNFWSS